jgi:hypothetical protein
MTYVKINRKEMEYGEVDWMNWPSGEIILSLFKNTFVFLPLY